MKGNYLMSWNQSEKIKGPFQCGSDAMGSTFLFGNPQGDIAQIFVDGGNQFAPGDFRSALHRMGNINGITNSDYQNTIMEIFSGGIKI